MHPFRKILLIFSVLIASTVWGQNPSDNIAQIFATANFNTLKNYWAPQVEMTIEATANNKVMSSELAQQAIINFYNQKGVINFEKTADRQLGNITYVTGKLIADKSKYNLTIMMQQTKKDLSIISLRIN
jgi:hypothetical protein